MPPLLPALALLACQEPFDVSRKDLGPFRVAALGVQDGLAQAAIWSGEGLFHSAAPALAWTLDGEALGEGWDVEVPGAGVLGLTVTAPDGSEHQAQLPVTERSLTDTPPRPELTREAVTLGDDLRLDTRQGLEATALSTSAPEGDAVRLTLGASEGTTLRWMTAAGLGTLLELDAQRADVLAEELAWDDDAVLVQRDPLGPGLYPQLALLLDGAGGNTWLWADAAIGVDSPLLRHEGRLLPADDDLGGAAGWVSAVLVAEDTLQGFRLEQVAAVPEGDLTAMDPLPCAPADQPFRLAWAAEGRCARPDLDGASVVLEVW